MLAINKAIQNLFLKPMINRPVMAPFVFVDRADDGPEVEILRAGKEIVRQGDNFVLAYIPPRVKGRYF